MSSFESYSNSSNKCPTIKLCAALHKYMHSLKSVRNTLKFQSLVCKVFFSEGCDDVIGVLHSVFEQLVQSTISAEEELGGLVEGMRHMVYAYTAVHMQIGRR